MVEENLSHFSLIAWEGLSTELPKLLSIDNKLQTGSRCQNACFGLSIAALLYIAIPRLSMSTRRRTVLYLLSAGKDKLYLLLITVLVTSSTLPCAPAARS